MGESLGIRTRALLTRMDSPIGNNVGNALEVAEAVRCLNGGGPASLVHITSKLGRLDTAGFLSCCRSETHWNFARVCVLSGGELLESIGKAESPAQGAELIERTLVDGSAKEKFIDMLVWQGVDRAVATGLCRVDYDSTDGCDTMTSLPRAKHKTELRSLTGGKMRVVREIEERQCFRVEY